MDDDERHVAARGGLQIQCDHSPAAGYRIQLSYVLDRDERAGTVVTGAYDVDQLDRLIESLVAGRDHLRRHLAGAARGSDARVDYMPMDVTADPIEHEAPMRFVWTRYGEDDSRDS
jgi:hypothetical protein